jgi:ketosteroid isomerase-like protein
MSDWRAELCRRSYAAFRTLDIDALLPLYEPDCEWHVGHARAVVGTPTYRGHQGLRAYVRDIGSVYPDFSPEIDEIRTRADGALVLRFRVSATARAIAGKLTFPCERHFAISISSAAVVS